MPAASTDRILQGARQRRSLAIGALPTPHGCFSPDPADFIGRAFLAGWSLGTGREERAPIAPLSPSLLSSVALLSGEVAQLVEHTTENRSVDGSIPPLATIFKSF
jgi:hypothetical protein